MRKETKKVKKKRLRKVEKGKRKKIFALLALIILTSIFVAAWYLTSRPKPTGTLIIHVVDGDTANPIGGATVYVKGLDEYHGVNKTDEQGSFIFESIPAGTYTVCAMKIDYHEHYETVTVEAGKTTNCTCTIHTHH